MLENLILPSFPDFCDKPSEDRLERASCYLVDQADALFLAGKVTQAEYDAWHKALDAWADRQYARRV